MASLFGRLTRKVEKEKHEKLWKSASLSCKVTSDDAKQSTHPNKGLQSLRVLQVASEKGTWATAGRILVPWPQIQRERERERYWVVLVSISGAWEPASMQIYCAANTNVLICLNLSKIELTNEEMEISWDVRCHDLTVTYSYHVRA